MQAPDTMDRSETGIAQQDRGPSGSFKSSRLASMTAPPSFAESLIQHRFLKNATAHPDWPCLEFSGHTSTYGEVERLSAFLGRGLIEKRVPPRKIVAVIADRCDSIIWTLLGILRIGAAFTVIDSAYPRKRIESLLALASPVLVVTCQIGKGEGGPYSVSAPVVDQSLLCEIGMASAAELDHIETPDSLAYCLFTSGSTGNPKCVACSHSPLVNFIGWHIETFGFTASDRFSALSGLSHDPVLRDIFTSLSIGGVLVIPTQSMFSEIGGVRQFLLQKRVSVIHLTPPLGHLILSGRSNGQALTDVRYFFWGGDKLTVATVEAMRNLAPYAEHINFYGSTETPQAATFYRCPAHLPTDGIPIGKGTRGFDVKIVGDDHRPRSSGEIGEIAIVSRFLSLGYVETGRIASPDQVDCDSQSPKRYFTGDRGYVRPDGNVMIVGRSDDQIKIRGYRIDLSEITSCLSRHEDVVTAIALPFGAEEHRKIGGFVVTKPQSSVSALDLVAFIATHLPSYMVANDIFLLPNGLPLLPNGKIDRSALIDLANQTINGKASPQVEIVGNAVLAGMVAGWADVFQRDDVGPGSSFSELCGDSLTYVGAYLVAEEWLGSVPDDWQNMPLRELAAVSDKKNRHVAFIDSVIVMRAVSMALIVAYHADLTGMGEGATAALFIISGFLFGKSMSRSMFDSARSNLLLRPLRSLFIPTAVFAIFGTIYVFKRFGLFFPASALLMADIVPEANRHPYIEANVYWYLEALIKIIVATFLLQRLAARYRPGPPSQKRFIAVVAATLCSVRLILPIVMHYMAPGFRETDVYYYNFVSNMGLFYVGILLLRLESSSGKKWALAALTAYTLLCVPDFGVVSNAYFIVAVVLILFVPRIAVPRLISPAIYEIASASLYIYLIHFWLFKPWRSIEHVVDLTSSWVGCSKLVIGICGGIALSRLVKYCQNRIHGRIGRVAAGSAAAEEV